MIVSVLRAMGDLSQSPLQPVFFHGQLCCSGVKWFGVCSRCETGIGIGVDLITEAFILLWLIPE